MVQNRLFQFDRQPAHLDVLLPCHLQPMPYQILGRRAAQEKSLTAINALRSRYARVVAHVAGQHLDARIVESTKGELPGSKRQPMTEVVIKVLVKDKVIFKEQQVIRLAFNSRDQGQVTIVNLSFLWVFKMAPIQLDVNGAVAPVGLRQIP